MIGKLGELVTAVKEAADGIEPLDRSMTTFGMALQVPRRRGGARWWWVGGTRTLACRQAAASARCCWFTGASTQAEQQA